MCSINVRNFISTPKRGVGSLVHRVFFVRFFSSHLPPPPPTGFYLFTKDYRRKKNICHSSPGRDHFSRIIYVDAVAPPSIPRDAVVHHQDAAVADPEDVAAAIAVDPHTLPTPWIPTDNA